MGNFEFPSHLALVSLPSGSVWQEKRSFSHISHKEVISSEEQGRAVTVKKSGHFFSTWRRETVRVVFYIFFSTFKSASFQRESCWGESQTEKRPLFSLGRITTTEKSSERFRLFRVITSTRVKSRDQMPRTCYRHLSSYTAHWMPMDFFQLLRRLFR